MSDQRNYADMSDSEKKKEDWMNSKWRPAMGWLYMLVCFCDFVLFPVLHAIYVAALFKGGVPANGIPSQWAPLTLQGAGLFHLAMGAVLGLAAWGRTQEKMNGANNGGLSLPSGGAPAFGAPAAGGFGSAPQTGGFGAPSTTSSFGGGGFGGAPAMVPRSTTVTTTSTFGAPAAPMMSSSGKPMPMQPDQPEI